ncbi:MAG TPA: hypothetical protein VFA38_00930 [Nitrospirales bacterium]|nr:hypothetical protein [Nitrospirales bacterium]
MKTLIALFVGVGMALSLSMALANPALLPKHPGYPASGNANDQGQTNMGGDKAMLQSAEYGRHTEQELRPETGRDAIINENGAGRLPKHPGYYDYKIEPPVKEATRMPK